MVAEDQGTATIVDDDGTLSLSSVEKKEGDSGTTLYTFHAVGTCGTPGAPCYLSVAVDPTGGSATAGADYTNPAPLTVVVSGSYDRTFTVLVKGDTTPEDDESFGVVAGVTDGPGGQNLGNGYGYGYILDDDNNPDRTRVSVSYVAAEEGDSGTTSLVFHVTGRCNGCYLNVGTESESATAHEDYVPPPERSVPVAGDFDEIVTVDVLGDEDFEADETFRVRASLTSNPGQGVNYAFANGQGTILNDEPAPPTAVSVTESVVQDEGDSGDTIYTFRVSGTCGDRDAQCYVGLYTPGTDPSDTATRNVDYVDAPGNRVAVGPSFSLDFTVTVKGDTNPEDDEVFTVLAFLTTQDGYGGAVSDTGKATIVDDD